MAANDGVMPLAKQVSPTRSGAPVNEEVCRTCEVDRASSVHKVYATAPQGVLGNGFCGRRTRRSSRTLLRLPGGTGVVVDGRTHHANLPCWP